MYGIINNGEPAMTYHPDGEKMPLTIRNELGICVIMPVFIHDGEPDESRVIVEVWHREIYNLLYRKNKEVYLWLKKN